MTIHTARPGLVIGKKGADIEVLRKSLSKIVEDDVRVNLVEVRKPEIDAKLVADDIARQLERSGLFPPRDEAVDPEPMRLGALGCA